MKSKKKNCDRKLCFLIIQLLLRKVEQKKFKSDARLKHNIFGMKVFLSKLYKSLQMKNLRKNEYLKIQKIHFRRAIKKLKYLRNFQKSYRVVYNNRLRRLANHCMKKFFLKSSLRNILYKILNKNQERKKLIYFFEWARITKQKKQYEEKKNIAKKKCKLKTFDSWNISLIQKKYHENLMKNSDNFHKLKILKKQFLIMKNYLLQNKNKTFKKLLIINKSALDFFLRKKLRSIKQCASKESSRCKRNNFAMKLGNEMIIRKLFLRWYVRIGFNNNQIKKINHRIVYNDKVNKITKSEIKKYFHRNKMGKINLENCDNNQENGIIYEERNTKIIQNFSTKKTNMEKSSHTVEYENSSFLKSWETEDGRRILELKILQCRNKYLLLASIQILVENRRKSKKYTKESNYFSDYLREKKKKLFIRVLLKLIRRKHGKSKFDKVFIVQSNEQKLGSCLNKLNSYFISRWTESQRVRLSEIYYRKFMLRKVLKKLANIVKHLKRKYCVPTTRKERELEGRII